LNNPHFRRFTAAAVSKKFVWHVNAYKGCCAVYVTILHIIYQVGGRVEPTSLRKMHLVPQQRQKQDETLLDFIDHLIEKFLGSEE